jgi:hypothetical protein
MSDCLKDATCERRYSWRNGPVKVCCRPAIGFYRLGVKTLPLCRQCAVASTFAYRVTPVVQDGESAANLLGEHVAFEGPPWAGVVESVEGSICHIVGHHGAEVSMPASQLRILR